MILMYINQFIEYLSDKFGFCYAYAGDFGNDDSDIRILMKKNDDNDDVVLKKAKSGSSNKEKKSDSNEKSSKVEDKKTDTETVQTVDENVKPPLDEVLLNKGNEDKIETVDSAIKSDSDKIIMSAKTAKMENKHKNHGIDKFLSPVRLFKRVDKEYLHNTFGRVVTAKTSFYGKPFKVHIIAKDIVRYNAKLISEKLRIANTKYCLEVKKLIDSCMANARYFGIDESKMCIKSLYVGRGKYLKRREFKGRGRTGVIWRPFSNVEIKLQEVNFG